MDEFAQTRAPDDLFFDDDYTPLPAPTPQIYETEQTPPLELQNNRSASPSKESEVQPPDQPPAPVLTNSPTPTSPPTARSTNVIAQSPTAPRIAPVRGDRHLTGGLVKPKLTEEELSSKLAAAKLNSAKRAEAHRLAEADEADFHAREAKVQVRRQEEGKARRVMDMERERNRIRKLGAQGGREWDEGKEEVKPEPARGFRRGYNGSVGIRGDRGGRRGRGGRENDLFQDKPEEEGYGQRNGYGARGRGRGRGRGGGFQPKIQEREQRAPDPVNDFPALPSTSKPKDSKNVPPDKMAKSDIQSWADQVTEAQEK